MCILEHPPLLIKVSSFRFRIILIFLCLIKFFIKCIFLDAEYGRTLLIFYEEKSFFFFWFIPDASIANDTAI